MSFHVPEPVRRLRGAGEFWRKGLTGNGLVRSGARCVGAGIGMGCARISGMVALVYGNERRRMFVALKRVSLTAAFDTVARVLPSRWTAKAGQFPEFDRRATRLAGDLGWREPAAF